MKKKFTDFFGARVSKSVLALLLLLGSQAFGYAQQKTVVMNEAGTIGNMISDEEKYAITDLKVSGPINGTDILFIREMVGRSQYGSATEGKCSILDLSEARIVEGGGSYIYWNSMTEDDVIGYNMFAECNVLKSIQLPETTTVIDGCAFYRCYSLENISIPESVTHIYSNAFFADSALVTINIPKNVAFIDDAVFSGCAAMTSITVDSENPYYSSVDGVLFNKAEDNLLAFPSGRTGEYTVAPTVKSIAPAAFNQCNLEKVIVSEGVTFIGDAAFANSYSLQSVTLPNSLTEIEHETFVWCDKMSELILGNALETIGYKAFVACSSLVSINIPNSVKTIGNSAFANCSGLKEVNIGSSVSEIGTDVFISDKQLTAINVSSDNQTFSSVDGVLFNKNASEIIKHPEGKGGDYVVPASVEKISDEAFYNCANITSLSMSNSVLEIGEGAFTGCKGMTDAVLSEELETLPYALFENCEMLDSVSFGDKVEVIGERAFASCKSLKSIKFPSVLTSVEYSAFDFCSGLQNIYAMCVVPPTCKSTDDSFYKVETEKINMFVPQESVADYKAHDVWKCFNILSNEPSGIVGKTTTESKLISIYDVEGRKIAENVEQSSVSLNRGTYIFKDENTGKTKKIVMP